MARTIVRSVVAALAALLVFSAASAQAGVWKNLLEKMDKCMNNYNNNMWLGENSVGKTALKGLKGEGGGFFKTFDATAAALMKAQNDALADTKEVLKAVSDIVFWLPKKLQAAFNKVMDGVKKFMGKLGAMNQGATVKERWKNMVGASGGGGGGAPTAQALTLDEPSSAAEPASESGAISGDTLSDLLGNEDANSHASVDLEEIYRLYGEDETEGPRAAASMDEEVGAEGFGKLIDISYAIGDKGQQTEARKRIRVAYLGTLDRALASNKLPEAAELIKSGAKLYRGNADGMRKAMEAVATRHPAHAQAITRHAVRMSNLAKTAGRN